MKEENPNVNDKAYGMAAPAALRQLFGPGQSSHVEAFEDSIRILLITSVGQIETIFPQLDGVHLPEWVNSALTEEPCPVEQEPQREESVGSAALHSNDEPSEQVPKADSSSTYQETTAPQRGLDAEEHERQQTTLQQ
eukprot:407107-Amphidinium_carterae.1